MAELWTKKKKILTRKERFKITDDPSKYKEENIEKLQSEKEDFYQQLQAEEKQQQALAQQEHDNRISSLSYICECFRDFHKTTVRLEEHSRSNLIRLQYPQLKNLNRIVPWINELISGWRDCERRRNKRYSDVKSSIEDCIGILSTLNLYLENPMGIEHLENWYECQRNVRKLLYEYVNAATYSVLTNIEKEMGYLNADIMFYTDKCEFYIHAIWTVLEKVRHAKDEKFPLHCRLEDCGLVVHMPKMFAYKAFAVRSFVMLTDYFTNDCRSAVEFPQPRVWHGSLIEHVQNLWKRRRQIREKIEREMATVRAEQEKHESILSKIKHLIPNSASSQSASKDTETVSTSPTTAEVTTESAVTDLSYLTKVIEMKRSYAKKAIDEERREIEDLKEYYKVETETYECNMRKFHIVGGVFHLNLVRQPPQPKMLKDNAVLRLIVGEDCLQEWPYSETYEPPVNKNGLVKQPTNDDDEDVENTPEGALIAKLILIVMKLPDHVLWFDAPIPVHWDEKKAYWSTEHIYEVKFNEEKQTLSCRVGKMAVLGLAVFRFNNLPFQSWELKKSGGGGLASPEVTFTLTTATLALEFVIRVDEVTLTMLENANTSALQELVGIPYKPRTLLRLLRTGGVNIFPSADAFQYIDGVQVKHHVTENHLYRCMALLCLRYRFLWSRWNLMCGYKKFVLQWRDADAEKGNNELLLVTDQRAFVTEHTDVNQAFAEYENALAAELTSSNFHHPDLWSLAVSRDGEGVRAIVDTLDAVFIETVYFMLSETKIMSYS